MDQIYYGCMTKNVDETNKLIGLGKKCLLPTTQCFWKHSRNIKHCRVKTRSYTEKEPTVSVEDYDNYFKQKQWIDHWVLETTSEDN